uniref:hypothetical protein n=1 Tax=Desulfobacter curvatus TaxID=2290 RepID=UPI000526B752
MKISKKTKSKENTSLKNFSEENHATKHTRYINSHSHDFVTARINIYGKIKQVDFLCLDLIWKP